MIVVAHWFRAFLWTLLLEQLVAGMLLRRALPRPAQRIGAVALANLASHPAVWLIFPELGNALSWSHVELLLVSELWAFGLEAWVYWLLLGGSRFRLALSASTLANGCSFLAGLGLHALGWA